MAAADVVQPGLPAPKPVAADGVAEVVTPPLPPKTPEPVVKDLATQLEQLCSPERTKQAVFILLDFDETMCHQLTTEPLPGVIDFINWALLQGYEIAVATKNIGTSVAEELGKIRSKRGDLGSDEYLAVAKAHLLSGKKHIRKWLRQYGVTENKIEGIEIVAGRNGPFAENGKNSHAELLTEMRVRKDIQCSPARTMLYDDNADNVLAAVNFGYHATLVPSENGFQEIFWPLQLQLWQKHRSAFLTLTATELASSLAEIISANLDKEGMTAANKQVLSSFLILCKHVKFLHDFPQKNGFIKHEFQWQMVASEENVIQYSCKAASVAEAEDLATSLRQTLFQKFASIDPSTRQFFDYIPEPNGSGGYILNVYCAEVHRDAIKQIYDSYQRPKQDYDKVEGQRNEIRGYQFHGFANENEARQYAVQLRYALFNYNVFYDQERVFVTYKNRNLAGYVQNLQGLLSTTSSPKASVGTTKRGVKFFAAQEMQKAPSPNAMQVTPPASPRSPSLPPMLDKEADREEMESRKIRQCFKPIGS